MAKAKKTEKTVQSAGTKYKAYDLLVQDLITYTKLGHNVMLVGKHGVGKTSAIQDACKQAGLKLWYKSAPLMDPEIDFGGIPIPNKEKGVLEFFSVPELFEAEVIFMDELNRASPRTLNMIFEIVQFKTINGKPLPKLKAIHTGINPPGQGQYDVQQLDDALIDRFHAFIDVVPEYPQVPMRKVLGEGPAEAAFESWYTEHVKNVYVPPRRLVYAAMAFAAGMPLERAFNDPQVPVARLREMLGNLKVSAAGIEKAESAGPPPIWMEEKFQKALNDPSLAQATEDLAEAMKAANITPEMVWDKMAELRKLRAEYEAKHGPIT